MASATPLPAATATASPGWGARTEAERWLEIAGRLLHARDFVGSKRFAERAMEVDPLLSGVDEVLAVSDVLLAAQGLVGDRPDYYSILQLPADPLSPPDTSSLKLSYRRLALLLSPSRNRHPGADLALQYVSDAFSFLSDPSRKLLFDQDLPSLPNGNASEKPDQSTARTPSPPPPPPQSSFWTMCSTCFRAHEYQTAHRNSVLRCTACHNSFLASQLPSPPPIVPGTDMYYCSWGLFPLGFPGCPNFTGVRIPESIMHNSLFFHSSAKVGPGDVDVDEDDHDHRGYKKKRKNNRTQVQSTPSADCSSRKKSLVRKARRPMGRPRGRPRKNLGVGGGSNDGEAAKLGQEVGGGAAKLVQEVQQVQDAGGTAEETHESENVGDVPPGFDMNSFSIDLDATGEAFGKAFGTFSHLSFVRDDEVVIMR